VTRADQHRRIARELLETFQRDLARERTLATLPAVTAEMGLLAGIEIELEKAFKRGRSRS
jgi:hypothetical protein